MTSSSTAPPKQFAYWSLIPVPRPILSHSLPCILLFFLSATHSLPGHVCSSAVQSFLSSLSLFLLRSTFLLTAIVSFLHQSGALRRYALQFAEDELSKAMNGALVTLSDIRVDVWRGKVTVQDLVVHNKDREAWEWESPCLVRAGRIEVTLNFASVIEIPYYGPILGHSFKDVYTGLVEDVQVFVEKRRNVFNFHLLDGDLDIPNAALIMEDYNRRKLTASGATPPDGIDESDSFLTLSQSMSNGNTDEERLDNASIARDGGTQPREKLDEAAVIVEKLVGAVSNLGRAATDGGSKALQTALKNQKHSLVKMLQSSTTGNTDEPNDDIPKPKKDKVAESVSVLRQLGKVVEKNVTDIKDQVTFLQKPPKRKEGLPKKKMDVVRIGSFLLREMRIFTKDVLVQKKKNTNGSNSADAQENNGARTTTQWSRPIVIWELAITGAEFSPLMSERDSQTGMPVVGIPLDRAVDIILKRLVTEAAKSNTGKLIETAFGDVFSFLNMKPAKPGN